MLASFLSTRLKQKSTARAVLFCLERCLPLRARDVAFGSDVHCVSDVTPNGVVGKHHITATNGSNITMSEANNITFAIAKTSLTEKERTFRISRFALSFLFIIRVWAQPVKHLSRQMRCSHLTVFFKFSAKDITPWLLGVFVFYLSVLVSYFSIVEAIFSLT